MNNENLGNFLNALGVILGFINIELNDKQIEQLNGHLEQQDNAFLKKIVDQNEVIIEKLDFLIDKLKSL